MIMFKKNFQGDSILLDSGEDGRILCVKVRLENLEFVLLNLYAPNTDEPEFFEIMSRKLVDSEIDEKLVLGDFNLSISKTDNSKGKPHANTKAVRKVIDIVELVSEIRGRRHSELHLVPSRTRTLSSTTRLYICYKNTRS